MACICATHSTEKMITRKPPSATSRWQTDLPQVDLAIPGEDECRVRTPELELS